MKVIPLLTLATAGLLAGGCATSVNTVQRAEAQAMPSYVNDQRVITDSSLGRTLAIVSVNDAKVSGDLLKVQVTLENRSGRAKRFNYKFDWIAEDGMEMQTAGGWRTLHLEGREQRSVSAIATSPRAVDFRLKLMEP